VRRADVEQMTADMAAGICRDLGLEFVDCKYRKRDGKWLLLIRVDRATGVSVQDCASVTRLLGEKLDQADPIEHGYILEVSSVGLSGPLRSDEDFRRFLGRPVEVFLSSGSGRQHAKADGHVLVGRLLAFDSSSLTLDSGEGPVKIGRGRVQRARPAVDFGGTGEKAQ